MVKVVIVEDEPIYASQLEILLEKIGCEVAASFLSTQNVKEFIQDNEVHIILLDINLNNELSISFAEEIVDENIPIIFITQYEDTEIYKKTLSIPHSSFLVKPFHQFTLDRTIKLLLSQAESSRGNYIRDGRNRIMIKPSEILWIRVEGNYSYIKTKEKQFVFKKSLAQIKRVVPSNIFIQVHRNYIVPITEVSRVNMTDNFLSISDEKIPISRRYKVNIMREIKELL